VLAVIETDKAAMEVEAYDDGVLTPLIVEEGDTVPIGTPIAVIGGEGVSEAAAPSPVPAYGQPERVAVSLPGSRVSPGRRPRFARRPRPWPASSPASAGAT